MDNNRRVSIAVLPDAQFANMWRVRWPDGHLSDMVNISRANELAERLRKREKEKNRKKGQAT